MMNKILFTSDLISSVARNYISNRKFYQRYSLYSSSHFIRNYIHLFDVYDWKDKQLQTQNIKVYDDTLMHTLTRWWRRSLTSNGWMSDHFLP